MSVITVVATVEPDSIPQRVRLDVTDVGSPNLFAATVTRLDPDGRVVPVRTDDGNPLVLTTFGANRVGIGYDYEMPYGVPVTYSSVESPAVSTAEVTVNETSIWLIHPGVPALSMPIELRAGSLQEEEYPVRQGIFRPMGRTNPVVVTDGARGGLSSSMKVSTETLAELAALRALISDAGTVLLNIPTSLELGIDSSYIAVGGVTVVRLTGIGQDPQRTVTMPFTVVDRPVGGTTAARTYVDLLSYTSYADLLAAYNTYLDVLAGP